MNEQKKKASFVNPSLDIKKVCHLPYAKEIVIVNDPCADPVQFKRLDPPTIVKRCLGSSPHILSFDIETNDCITHTKQQRKGRQGQFGHYTIIPPEDLRFQCIGEIAWTMGVPKTNAEIFAKA